MVNQFSRTELVFGTDGVKTLHQKTVAVLGAGGVGSFAMEALARSGIGQLILIDKDTVDITNVNRQLPALTTTVGHPKVDVMKERIHAINPECTVIAKKVFFTQENEDELFGFDSLDYVVDAIDVVSAKIHLIQSCVKRNIPIVSSMGAANKLDPTRFRVMDLADTKVDPIAKVLRRELKKLGIAKGVKTVCSDEPPREPLENVRRDIVPEEKTDSKIRKEKMPPASTAYVPSVAGLILASVVIHDLLGIEL
ncbi:ThiF family adenylyltransferase [Alicyclobacillus sp. SO9]|uniref:tRNA threonylcarbamoyladenosine dehydratase n=1 Tax=Alicyclobacillus sp. SO9 TaxID=2665646 RepID=UPI0018E6FBC6|nr:tRNA threonylcarbamoyladenosine dehydratase [Alicyclobacillus sp. SO9]QQE80354.1 tRNA threonylcarbamoyladenosine dehydratase [Alicyclobacillus sp. SO9]